jgi:hypothetical protein
VTFVHEPIEIAAPPPKLDDRISLEGAGDRAEILERDALQLAALNKRNDVLGHARATREILLAPRQAVPERPKSGADADIHAATISSGASPAITYDARS